MAPSPFDDIHKFMGDGARRAKFKDVDRRAIAKMSDHELALWQSEYPEDSPQFILANHEWQRRLTIEQVNASRFAAFMGLLGAVVGAFITWLASK
ncbi:MAG TPA: hypothetical protein VMV78_12325 [Thiobacillus sp.]|jgi:hypothetical protein|nr:hypothetical protein [Thiobacillus sp.]